MISVDIRFWPYLAAMQVYSDPVWDALARGVRAGGSAYVRARVVEQWFASQVEELRRTEEDRRAQAYATTAKAIHVALEPR